MKNYLLFAGAEFYPDGGAEDFIGCFESIAAAMDSFDKNLFDWGNIFDMQSQKIVKSFDGDWIEGSRFKD